MSQDFTSINQPDEEAQLARRLAGRDPQALAELYDRYGRLAYLLVYRIVGNESVSQDIVQEAFLKVWNSFPLFDHERGSLGRWVLSVARNRAIDYLRSWEGRMARGACPIQDWDQPSMGADFEEDVLNRDLLRALRGAMTRLTPQQQRILDLAYVE